MLKFGAKKGDRWNYNIGSVASGTLEMVDLFEFAGQTIAIIKNEEEDTGVRPIHSQDHYLVLPWLRRGAGAVV